MPLVLIIIGIILIIYNYRAIKREGQVIEDDNSLNISFQSVLQDNKEELNDYKMEIGLLRRDIAESLTELQEEIFDIKNNLNRLKNSNRTYENKEGLENNYYEDENEINVDINNKLNVEEQEYIGKDDINNEIDKHTFVNQDINDGIISEIDFLDKIGSNKTRSIKKLLDEGLTEEQICHELSVSKGEVLLVKGLFKK